MLARIRAYLSDLREGAWLMPSLVRSLWRDFPSMFERWVTRWAASWNPDIPSAPPEGVSPCRPPPGPPSKDRSGSTS